MKKTGTLLMWLLAGFMVTGALVYAPSLSSGILLLCAVVAAPVRPLQELLASKKVKGAAKGGILAALFLAACIAAPTDRVSDRSAGAEPPISIHGVETPSPADRSAPSPSEATDVLPAPSQAPTQEAPASPSPAPAQEEPASLSPASAQEAPASLSPASAQEEPASPSQAPTPEAPASPPQTPTQEAPSPSQTAAGNGAADGGNGGGNGDAGNFDTWNNPEQQQTTAEWVLNTNTKKIHYPSCSSVEKIAPQNYSTSNLSESELISQGYTVCKRCH